MAVFRVKGFNKDFEAITEALSAYDAKRKVLENPDAKSPFILDRNVDHWTAEVILGSGTIEYRTGTSRGSRQELLNR